MCIFTDYARNGVFKAKIRNKLRKIVMVGTSALVMEVKPKFRAR